MSAVDVLPPDERIWPRLDGYQRAFLLAYSECGSLSEAANLAGIGHRNSHYYWMRSACTSGDCPPDSECYGCAFMQAKHRAGDAIEDRMWERAIKGDMAWDATRGIFVLKSIRREVYGERLDIRQQLVSINLTGDIASLTDTDRVSLLQLAADEQRRLLELPEPSHPDDQD